MPQFVRGLVTDSDRRLAHTNLDSGKPFMVAVFAAWCPHCVRMTEPSAGEKQSQWASFVSKFEKQYGTKVPILEVKYEDLELLKTNSPNCELSKILASAVTSFPHFSVVMKDKRAKKINVHVYDGPYPMTADTLMQFSRGRV